MLTLSTLHSWYYLLGFHDDKSIWNPTQEIEWNDRCTRMLVKKPTEPL